MAGFKEFRLDYDDEGDDDPAQELEGHQAAAGIESEYGADWTIDLKALGRAFRSSVYSRVASMQKDGPAGWVQIWRLFKRPGPNQSRLLLPGRYVPRYRVSVSAEMGKNCKKKSAAEAAAKKKQNLARRPAGDFPIFWDRVLLKSEVILEMSFTVLPASAKNGMKQKDYIFEFISAEETDVFCEEIWNQGDDI
eukprot:s3599_g2.t1